MSSLLEEAERLGAQGQWQKALALLQRACEKESPPLVWVSLAKAYAHLGRWEEAMGAVEKALSLEPGHLGAMACKAALGIEMGHYRESVSLSERVLARRPDHLPTLINRSTALVRLGRMEAALQAIDEALSSNVEHPILHLNRGLALQGLGRLREARASFERALAMNPDYVLAYINLASLLLQQGDMQGALSLCRKALRRQPANIQALVNKALALLKLGRYDEALEAAERILAIKPRHREGLALLRMALMALERFEEALAAAERLLILCPDDPSAMDDKVAALLELGHLEDALPVAREALAAGERFSALFNHGAVLACLGRFEEADAFLAKARRMDEEGFKALFAWKGEDPPSLFDARAYYVTRHFHWFKRAQWERWHAFVQGLPSLVEERLRAGELPPIHPFKTLLVPLDPGLQRHVAQAWARDVEKRVGFVDSPSPPASERLRIGYLSADFRHHPTAHLTRSLYGLHERTRFEVIAYSLKREDSDLQRHIARTCDRFVDLSELDDRQAAERIREDGVHILVDLMGHTRYARPEILARRPAPIQVNWLGYPGTTGAAWIDYIVADPVVLPRELEESFTEAPVRLPFSYQVNDRWQPVSEKAFTREEQGLPVRGFVFCCFNALRKIDPEVFALWMRILRQVEGGVLWLMDEGRTARTNLRREAERHGVAGERLVFAKHLPRPKHLARLRLSDLFLDTLSYGAHTTASDALWAGVPVLTLPGRTFASRVAASLLEAMALRECIVPDREAYQARAVHLATHPEALRELRGKVEQRRSDAPLFDTEGFVRYLEKAFLEMWARHREGMPPGPLWIEA